LTPKPFVLQSLWYGDWKDHLAFHRLDWAKEAHKNYAVHYPDEWRLVERIERVIENE
jgi:hypothetical protein